MHHEEASRKDAEIAKAQQQRDNLAKELFLVESILASALDYPWDIEYGWATGDHTTVTLAMTVHRKLRPDHDLEVVEDDTDKVAYATEKVPPR